MRCHDPRHRPSGSIEGMQRSKTPFGIFGGVHQKIGGAVFMRVPTAKMRVGNYGDT